jgi:hypothetical protein
MALTRLTRSSSSIDPLKQLGRVISDLLPHQGLPLIDKVRRWSDRLLVLAALMMGWAGGNSLGERFALARACLLEIHPTRKRPGAGYNGFIDALARHSTRLLNILTDVFRRRMLELAGTEYRLFGFIVFGVDGTKIQLPRSDANFEHFGIANKKHSSPEMLLCGLFHVATRTLWAFARDVAKGSERSLFASMLPCLPGNSLVLADAGFVGWNTMAALIDAGQHFVIRCGANVRLLRELGHAEEHGDIVYLWPVKQQKKQVPPIMLRRVIVRDGQRRCMCLLSNVLDAKRLSDKQIIQLYAMRWHVEVSYRWLKQSLNGRKMLSTSAAHAGLEMDWTLMSLWALTLISLAQGIPPQQLSVAGLLRTVRAAMTQRRLPGRRRLTAQLRRMRRDSYGRRSGKSKRHWPRRARVHRCGMPKTRMANTNEIKIFQCISARAA